MQSWIVAGMNISIFRSHVTQTRPRVRMTDEQTEREREWQLTVKAHVPRRIHSEIQKQCVLKDHALEWAIENILDGFVDVWRCSLRSIYDLHRIRTDSDNRWRVIVRFRTSICLAKDRSSTQRDTTITSVRLTYQRHTYSFSTDTSEIRVFPTGTSGQKIRSTSITDQITIRTWTKRCEGLLGERAARSLPSSTDVLMCSSLTFGCCSEKLRTN